ncbi:MAG: glycosyltransferase family 4 protein [Ancrocorticia sp.]|jgi:glycosyltransferase involved in cell wall biosynthesis|nr:glycosyltransferase family 4 protein [Ancrocorticia sp.]
MSKIAIVTLDVFGEKMAGPAIRVWEMARYLSQHHTVRVLTFGEAERDGDGFELRGTSVKRFEQDLASPDVVIIQGYLVRTFPWLGHRSFRLVVDLYDPLQIESLEVERDRLLEERRISFANARLELQAQLELGDFFLCASNRQRHLWLGALIQSGRLTPAVYDVDPTAEKLIDLVPFGLSVQTPIQTHRAIKGTIDGISLTDKVIVWGGGIYNWFDPCTVIRAVDIARRSLPSIRLVFMGAKHPNPDVPAMKMVAAARGLSDELGLTNTSVFFNDSWVDYSDRQNYLCDADLAVTAHFNNIETVFSFRTRVLDYLWCGLPIVTTEGDYFADLVREKHLGAVVPFEDAQAMAQAFETLLSDQEIYDAARDRVQLESASFRWPNVLEPLMRYCDHPWYAVDRPLSQRTRSKPSIEAKEEHLEQSLGTLAKKSVESIRLNGPKATLKHVRAFVSKRFQP